MSDARFRGVSLSRGQPAVQASVAYDHPAGGYAGLFASQVRLPERSGTDLQVLSYLGYSRSLAPGLSGELGTTYVTFTQGGEYAYPDLYVGVATRQVSVRLHDAVDYFGQSGAALYLEVNASHPLQERLALFGHVGVQQIRRRDAAGDRSDAMPCDWQIGLGLDLHAVNLQLTWEGTSASSTRYPFGDRGGETAVVFGLSRSF